MHQVLCTLHCMLRLGRLLWAMQALLLRLQDMHTACSCCPLKLVVTAVRGCHR